MNYFGLFNAHAPQALWSNFICRIIDIELGANHSSIICGHQNNISMQQAKLSLYSITYMFLNYLMENYM